LRALRAESLTMAQDGFVASGSGPGRLEHHRRRAGRPRKQPVGDNPGDVRPSLKLEHAVPATVSQHRTQALQASVRLLDRPGAARYLGVSVDTLDRLRIPRVVLPGCRLVRYDVRELDRFVELHAS